jgi:hypothetical protein
VLRGPAGTVDTAFTTLDRAIVDKLGWPSASLVGDDGTHAA